MMILLEAVKKAEEAQKQREAFRKRDTERLLQLNVEAVGIACKAFFAAGTAEYAPWEETENEEALAAYDLIMHLVWEDWEVDGR